MLRQSDECAFADSILRRGLACKLGEEVDAVLWLNSREPGERDTSRIHSTTHVGWPHLDYGAMIEAKKDIHPARLGLLASLGHTVSRPFELNFTAASIVRRSVRIAT
jgi:hypothetical protein